MCITEVWNYRDCGCIHERRLPCVSIYETRNFALPASPRSIYDSSVPLTEYSSRTNERQNPKNCFSDAHDDLNVPYQQGCAANRIVCKQFLESICDNCLLKEIGSERLSRSTTTHETGTNVNPRSLILSSEVTIEIEGRKALSPRAQWRLWPAQDDSSYAIAGRDSNRAAKAVSSSASSLTSDIRLKPGKLASPLTHINRESQQANDDADDEGSLRPVASSSSSDTSHTADHLVDHTKQIRRRAIDLTREDLRISSRWSSSERKSMEQFRDALKEAAIDKNESTFSKFVKKRKGSPSEQLKNVKSFVTGLKNSMSSTNLLGNTCRPRNMLGLDNATYNAETDLTGDDLRLTCRQLDVRNQYYAEQKLSERTPNASTNFSAVTNPDTTAYYNAAGGRSGKGHTNSTQQNDRPSPTSSAISSWNEHLKHDLTHRPRDKNGVDLASNVDKRNRYPHYLQLAPFPILDVCFTTPDASTCSCPSSDEISVADHTRGKGKPISQGHQRMHSSVYSSLPTNTSTQSSATYPLLRERLADVVSSGEFESVQNDETIDMLIAQHGMEGKSNDGVH